VQRVNHGPLPAKDLARIYERIMDVMRQIQKEGIGAATPKRETELDSDVSD
jgi:hypothetical protein